MFPRENLAEGGAAVPALSLSNKEIQDDSRIPFTEEIEKTKNVFIAPAVLEG